MNQSVVPIERIENCIFFIRGQRVMLDYDLSPLYGIETRSLIQAIKRNIERFPEDFMFQLSPEEFKNWKSQFATSKANSLRSQIVMSKGRGGRRTLPYAFTEQGVAMLSSVLHSPRAIAVNIEIMRAFVRMKHIFESNIKLAEAVSELRSFMLKNSNKADQEFRKVWNAIEKLSKPLPVDATPPKNPEPMGFRLK